MALLAGCSWVELRPGAEDVRLVSAAEVVECQFKGSVQAQTRSSVGFYDRSAETLQAELTTLARNQAVVMGANRLVTDSVISSEGSQKFRAFLCP